MKNKRINLMIKQKTKRNKNLMIRKLNLRIVKNKLMIINPREMKFNTK